MSLTTYELKVLNGTAEYVLKELLEKYPGVLVKKVAKEKIVFESLEKNIEIFRNLYSPTHIKDPTGRVVNLSRRSWRKEYVSAGINPSLAYILCTIAGLKESDIVYDPFCGTSTIPITAIKYCNVKRVLASDISGSAIDASLKNFLNADIPKERYKLFRSDISKIHLNKKNIDKIVSNLPFGIRVGSHEDNKQTYQDLEVVAEKLLRKKGELILLTQEKKLVKEVFKDWNIKSVLRVDEGGLLPEVFKITRKS